MSRRNSQLWLHFSEEGSDRKVKCLYCSVRISVANRSTCSLIRHLERKHKILFEHKASLKKSKNTSLVPVLKKETVNLYDKEKDMLVEVILSPEDACRAAKDNHFAGELVKLALQNSSTDEGGGGRATVGEGGADDQMEAEVVDPTVQLLEISETEGGGVVEQTVGVNGSGSHSSPLQPLPPPAAVSHLQPPPPAAVSHLQPPPPAAVSHHPPPPPPILGGDGSLYISYSESDGVPGHTDEIPDGKGYKWSPLSVMYLLQEYRTHWQELTSGQLTNGELCQLLSDRLKAAGHPPVAPSLIAIKLRALKKTYLSIKQHNINATGTDRRSWPYFEIMDAIHTNKRWCNPEVVEPPPPVSAASGAPAGATCAAAVGSDSETPLDSDSSSITSLLTKILRQREEHEANKKKRHKERMEMDRKMLEVLHKLVSK